jgi:hypothetical protein
VKVALPLAPEPFIGESPTSAAPPPVPVAVVSAVEAVVSSDVVVPAEEPPPLPHPARRRKITATTGRPRRMRFTSVRYEIRATFSPRRGTRAIEGEKGGFPRRRFSGIPVNKGRLLFFCPMKDVFRFAPAGELQAGELHLAAASLLGCRPRSSVLRSCRSRSDGSRSPSP